MSDTGEPRSGEAEHTSTTSDDREAAPDAHLTDVDDGCGCAEMWEHLSEQREE